MHYVAAAFPSACGKTNFAMMIPPDAFTGWKIRTVGDDIAWMRVGDGRSALGGEPGERLLRRRAGHEPQDEPQRDATRSSKDTLFTNVGPHRRRRRLVGGQGQRGARRAHRLEGPALEEGLDGEGGPPEQPLHRADARTTRRSRAFADDPKGVPISALIFGGRRSTTVPLVLQSFNWTHGVYLGATMGSETTAAAHGAEGGRAPRPDGDAALHAATTPAATSSTGSTCRAASRTRPRSSW